jgi:hypothetical protein
MMLAEQSARVTMLVAVKTAADQQPGVDQISLRRLSHTSLMPFEVHWMGSH